jgi:hypothetical protein
MGALLVLCVFFTALNAVMLAATGSLWSLFGLIFCGVMTVFNFVTARDGGW